jgi:hypothetical protein
MQYHADSVGGGVDTVNITLNIAGNGDSTHFMGGATYSASNLDSLVTALQTGLNESYALTELRFKVTPNVIANTAINAYVQYEISQTETGYKALVPAVPYSSVNLVAGLGSTAGQYHAVYGAGADTVWDAGFITLTAAPTNDWRVIRHELGHEWGLRHTHLNVTEVPSCASAAHEYPYNYWLDQAGIDADSATALAWSTNDVCEDTPPDPEFNVSAPYAANWDVDSCSTPNLYPWNRDSTTLYGTNLLSYIGATTAGPDSVTAQQCALVRCYFETNPVWRRTVTWVE